MIVAIGFYTIWFTPIVFIVSLLGAIKSIHSGESMKGNAIICAISFWLIIVPIFVTIIESS